MKKIYIIPALIIVLSLLGIYNLYDQISNWSELGENIRYLIVNIPLTVTILFLSKYNFKFGYKIDVKNFISWLGFIICAVLIIPPYIIYLIFIR